MSKTNPYTSRREPGEWRQKSDPTLLARLLWLIVPTMLGVAIGWIWLEPGDAGLTGFVGLGVGAFGRAIFCPR